MFSHEIADRLKPKDHSLKILQERIMLFSRDPCLFNRSRLQGVGLCSLLFTHIERKDYRLGAGLIETRHTEQHRHPRTVFTEKLLLERRQATDSFHPRDSIFVGGVPLWRR